MGTSRVSPQPSPFRWHLGTRLPKGVLSELLPFIDFSVSGFCINEEIKVICYQLELRSPWLVARYDEKAGREEQSSPNSDLQWCVSVVHGNGSVCSHFFTFTQMTTGAFSWNVGKLFSELKLVRDSCSSLFTLVDQSQSSTSWLTQICNQEMNFICNLLSCFMGTSGRPLTMAKSVR